MDADDTTAHPPEDNVYVVIAGKEVACRSLADAVELIYLEHAWDSEKTA